MKTDQILGFMKLVSWIIFIGLCIETGAILISTLICLFVNPEAATNVYLGSDLSGLYRTNQSYFLNIMSLTIALSAIKAYLFYLVVRIFSKINLDNPFSETTAALIARISHIALGLGLISILAQSYAKWLMHRGIQVEQFWGSSEFLFMAGIIFIIAQVFKRGIEIQSENDLTI